MRRIPSWALVIAAGAALACETPSEPRAAEGPALDPDGSVTEAAPIVARASGSAQRDALNRPVILNFHAIKRADGSVEGEYYYRAIGTDPDQWLKVSVTCMTVVDGNKAWIGGIATDAFLPGLIGRVSYFYTFDNGEGAAAAGDVVSLVRANDVAGADQEFCDELPAVLPPRDVLRGNVQVEG